MDIKPYTVDVPESSLERQKTRLSLTSFSDELDDVGWEMGAPLAGIKRLVAYWQNGYDWRRTETALNEELPQFQTEIQCDGFESLNIHFIHFIHRKSSKPRAIPLLSSHGCKRTSLYRSSIG